MQRENALIFLTIISALLFIPLIILIRRYIKNSFKVATIFTLIFFFLAMSPSMALIVAKSIKNPQDLEAYVEVQLKPQSNLKISNPVKLITISDQYCLLYDARNKKVLIIRTDNIDYLTKEVN